MDKATLRQEVRAFLHMVRKGQICTLEMLIEGTRRLLVLTPTDEPATVKQEIMEAIEWNQTKGLLDYTFDSEAEVDSYHLTERGKEKLRA
jgi:hypothetical protein